MNYDLILTHILIFSVGLIVASMSSEFSKPANSGMAGIFIFIIALAILIGYHLP